MNKEFLLEISTPDKLFFEGKILSLIINTTHGEMGVIYNTLPMVTALQLGVCKYNVGGTWQEIMLGDGFIEVHPNGARLFAQFAVLPDEFEHMETHQYNLAEELEKKAQSRREYKMAKAYLARHFANLSGGKKGKLE